MHELSIAISIVESIEDEFKDKKDIKISEISIDVGEISSVVPEALEFVWEEAVLGSILDNSKLIIKVIPVRGYCKKCKKNTVVSDFECRSCGSPVVKLKGGDELRIDSVKVLDVD